MLAVTATAVLAITQAGSGANNPILYYCSGPQSEISNWNTDPVQTGGAQTAVLTVSGPECVLGAATYVSTAGNSATTGTITLANNQNLPSPVTIPTTADTNGVTAGFANMVGSLSATPPPTVVTNGTVSCSNDNVASWAFNSTSNGQGFCKLVVQPALVDSTAPTAALTAPSDGALVGRTVHFAASATDAESGVDHISIQVTPHGATSWQTVATVGPTGTVDWDSSGFNGSYDVRAAAFDKVGHETDTTPITVTIDSTPPTLTLQCNDGTGATTCGTGWYTVSRPQLVATSDAGPIVYAIDGAPIDSPLTYTGPINTAFGDHTYYFSVADAAGNLTTAQVEVKVDTSAPAKPSLTLGGSSVGAYLQQTANGYQVWWRPGINGEADLAVPQSDDPDSGIASANFPTSALPGGWGATKSGASAAYTWVSGASQPGPSFSVSSTNGAGLTSQVPTAVGFPVDPNPPTGGVNCDATACSNPNGPVTVTMALSDPQSGIKEIRYTTDGGVPSAANGTPIANGGSFMLEHNATVKVWAVDNVGNESAAISQPVTAAPAPGVFTVNTTSDTDDATAGDGQCADSAGACSLRAAIEEANALPAGSTIDVPAGSYQLVAALVVKNGMTITGAGARTTTISQSAAAHVFDVAATADGVTISGFTLTGGTATVSGDLGGDVRNMGNLTLREDTITGGTAFSGGGVSNAGGTMLIDRSTVSGNSATLGGADSGGVNNWGSAGNGGTAHGALTIRNSTIAGNTAGLGGAVDSWNDPANTVVIENSTIAGNTATGRGTGGLRIDSGTATVRNTIIAGNTQTTSNGTVASNCGGTGIQSLGHNLESGSDCGFAPANNGDLQNTDPKLGALQDNGGQTDTMLPAGDSPVVDAGDASCPNIDQRGTTRPQGNGCDIGAVELVPTVTASSCGVLGNCGFESALPAVFDNNCQPSPLPPTTFGNWLPFVSCNAAQIPPRQSTTTVHDGTASGEVTTVFHSTGGSGEFFLQDVPNASFDPNNGFDLSAWVDVTQGDTQVELLFDWDRCCGATGGTAGFTVDAADSQISWDAYGLGGAATVTPGSLTGSWHLVTLHADGATRSATLSLDGVSLGTNGGPGTAYPAINPASTLPHTTLVLGDLCGVGSCSANRHAFFDDVSLAQSSAATSSDPAQTGPTYTVNSAADPGDGTCTVADCTLREAITAANDGDVPATIKFSIGTGAATISPVFPLPAIGETTTIDGTTQPGFLATPLITIDGTEMDGVSDGLVLEAPNSAVRGIAVNHFPGIGIHVLNSAGEVIAGNFVGVGASGATAAANSGDGIRVENSTDVTVGGSTAADRNVVGANGGHGIFLDSATSSTVRGNYSGIGAFGGTAIANAIDGIAVDGGSGNTIVGNVASGNTSQGISLFGVSNPTTTGNVVRGNIVGTDAFRDTGIPNGGDGIRVANGNGNTIGGTGAGEGNFVHANGVDGVHLIGGSQNVVLGNSIVGNGGAGVGIEAKAPKNQVGGTDAGAGNTIDANGGAGVSVFSSGNAILGNSIDANGGVGIDLNGVGNALQPPPLIAAVRAAPGTLSVIGKFLAPGGTYRIEYFLSNACGAEGVSFVGSSQAVVNAGGEIALTAQIAVPRQLPGSFLTATATSSANNTSAFSRCVPLTFAGNATSATLGLTTDVQTTLPGAASVPLVDIPQSAFGKVTYDSNGNPLPPSIGLGSIGLGSIGLGSIGLGSIGLGSIDLGSTGLGSIGLGSIGLNDTTLLENGLGGIPLNTLPLKQPGSWEATLAGTPLAGLPIQTLTVKDVLDRAPTTLAGIGLGSIDLSHSGLGSIGLGSIALGSIGLGSIPLDSNSANTAAQNLAQWCTFVHAQPGFASFDCSTLAGQTVLGLALQGVPVASGLGSIGLGSIDLSGTGLGSIGLGSIDLADSGLGSIGLGSIGLGSIGLGSIGLGSIDLGATGLGSIGLGSIGLGSIGNIVDCTVVGIDCTSTTQTLSDAAAAHALKSTATLADLAGYFAVHPNEFTLADLVSYFVAHPEFTLAELIPDLPPTATVDDLLSALLGGTPRDWENTPLAGLAAFAGAPNATGGLVTYTAPFTIQGTGTAIATLTVTPPAGAYYVPGSATLSGGDTPTTLGDPLRGDGGTLEWQLDSLAYGTSYSLSFQLRPGLTLGPEQASVALSTNGIADISKQATVNVVDTFESNDSAISSPPPIKPATLYLSYLGNGKDVDYYTLHVDPSDAPAGTRIRILLSHLHSDDDVAVFGPGEPALRGSGLGSIGLGSIGLGSIAPGEQQVEPGETSQALQSDPAQDLPGTAVPSGDQLLAVSDNRGTVDEEADITSTGLAQDLIVQVSSYDGNPTTDPYLLRVEDDKPPALPPCSQLAPAGGGTTEATLPTNASIPSTAQTLILFNEKRLAQYYTQADASAVYARLKTYASQTTVNGVIVPVESDAGVAAAYANWDQNLCSPAAANGVVTAIGTLLDKLQANHPNLTTIVVVGADNIIPFARLLDTTQQANEVGFRSNFGFVNNEYVGAVAAGYLFSDDPYGDPSPRQFGAVFLYTPKYALGRLVESPGDIEKQLDTYDNVNHGVINPTSKLVSGYDFLTDGAQAVDSALPGTDTASDLINDSWTADQLRTDLFAPAAPTIDSVNAHYDQHQALSAAGNTAHNESAPNLFTTSDVPAGSVVGRIVFTMGCHAGFSLFDGLPYFTNPALMPTGFTQDWPQTYMANGAIAFMGNTGYGLGDTTAVAYSERLNQLFAQRLNGTMTIGQALQYAKQEYFGDLGVVSAYDQKVANEATFYGLPTYRLGTGTPPSAPPALPTYSDPRTGLTAADFTTQPQFKLNASRLTGGGSYYSATNDPNGLGIQVTNRRPIEPLTSLDVTEPGTTAHGVLITSLASQNFTPFTVSFGRVAVANSSIEPQLTGIADFPAQIQSLVNVATPNGPRQRAVLIAGHFASGSNGNVGTQRNYTSIGGTVLYSTSQDFVRPTITNMQVLQAGSTVGFSADIADLDQKGQAGTISEAIVLYLDGSGAWQRVNLACANGHCSGGGPLTGSTVDYVAEAVDAVGNVGVNANKAVARDVTRSNGSGHISISLNPGATTNGWLTASGTANVSSDDGAALSTSLDGAPYTPFSLAPSVPVSGDGLHVLDVRGSDGSTATFAVPVDTLPPTITVFAPAAGGFVLSGDAISFQCTDAGSGLAPTTGCVGSVPNGTVVTSTSGSQTLTVSAQDNVGHKSGTSATFQVWQWSGFLSPVNNPPTLNVAKAGSAIPVKFALGGNRGLNFLIPNSPGSQTVACDTGAPLDTVEQTVTAGTSSLQYDSTSNQYTYIWKTDSSWGGTCRELTLKFTNGDVRKAEFKFK